MSNEIHVNTIGAGMMVSNTNNSVNNVANTEKDQVKKVTQKDNSKNK